MSIARIVEHHAESLGEKHALHYQGIDVSHAELRERVRRTAGALAELGVGKGDVVAALLHNSLEFVDIMLAASYLGAIFMPLNWRLAGPELAYIVEHAGAAVLVTEEEFAEVVEAVRGDLTCRSFVALGETAGDGWEALASLVDAASPAAAPADMAPQDVLRLMYTSGTTARPKGVVITVGNLDAKCFAHTIELGLSREDRSLVAGPLYHVGALDLTFTTVLYLGGYQHLLRRFDPTAVLDAIERDRLTTTWLAPAMINLVLAEPSVDDRDLRSLRVLIDGGEKMPLPLIERILDLFPNAWFADAYGLTETVSGDTFLSKGESRHKLGSVGKPVFNTEVAVVDLDGMPLPPGKSGEIVIRGPKVCAGYWRDPEATAFAMRGGWFHTGDIGTLDEEGFLYVVDRIKDMIISGGENISSLEIERVLYEHPAVVEAAVVGRPDATWGEVPVAYVVLQRGADVSERDLIDFCLARLARFKAPKGVRCIEELPRNPSGKVLKRELRDREAAGTAAGAPEAVS